VLEVDHISVVFGGLKAVRDLSFSVALAEVRG
jgi:ABC-type uncharacterized transport system ATPase subunit